MTDDIKRLHFLGDVEHLGAAYRCQRCGHATATKVEMADHRSGLITDCLRERIKQRIGLGGGGES